VSSPRKTCPELVERILHRTPYGGNSRPKTRQGLSRRSFLAASLAAPFIVPRHILGDAGFQAPSDTLAIACVGAGGMVRHYLEGCKDERIVALCDLILAH
jgi:hypothetical protein